MDGHTSHINIAVSEFCSDHNIILYTFPPHASHLIQPLDVSFFGPLKKHWTSEVTNFTQTFKTSVSKNTFFQVFDNAWKKSIMKKNIQSGFVATGLVPFNPDRLDYSKILSKSPSVKGKNHNIMETPSNIEAQQRVIFKQSFFKICSVLSTDEIELFNLRYEDGYNIEDNTHFGKLWKIYKMMRDSTNIGKTNENENYSGESDHGSVIPETPSPPNSPNAPPIQDNNTTQVVAMKVVTEPTTPMPPAAQPSTSYEGNNATISEPISSTNDSNVCRKLSYTKFPYSPFKNYLKIDDEIIISRKITKTKPKVPPAISGTESVNYFKRLQDAKKEALEQKEKRKIMREQKKNDKIMSKGKKRKEPEEEENQSEEEEQSEDVEEPIRYDDSTDDEEVFDDSSCGACEGKDYWEDGSKWIGCNDCSQWYHRSCLAINFMEMTEIEIKDFYFSCPKCNK